MAERGGRGRVIGDYVLEKQIGSGSFAVVWRSRHLQRGYEVAVKEIATEKLSNKLLDSLFSEINILRQINHPNIVCLHDIVRTSGRIYLVLEYCTGGDLAAYIHRHRRSSEVVARHFMRQLAAGLQVLHENNLMHRDLKPQNILLSTNDRNAVLKIADFGFARTLQPQGLADTVCGSPLYMAPEILRRQMYNAKADLWSVGTILFQLVTGIPPFSGNNQAQLLDNILKSNELYFPPDIVGDLHPDCIDLCRRLLRKNPVERLSFEEFFNHKFMVQGRSMGSLENISTRSGGTQPVENEETPQYDCLPFILDEDRQAPFILDEDRPLPSTKSTFAVLNSCIPPDSNALARRTRSVKSSPGKKVHSDYPEVDTNLEVSSNHKLQRSFGSGPDKNSMLKVSQTASTGQEHLKTASLKLVDSLECIEQEYVLVNAYGSSTETFSSSLCVSGLDHSQGNIAIFSSKIQKSTSGPSQIVGAVVGSVGGVESLGSQISIPSGTSHTSIDANNMLDRPLDHSPTRLQSLQRCAYSIAELAKEKLNSGHQLEAFSIQMLCLAIWKKAVHVSHNWASSFTGSSSQDGLATVDGLQKTRSIQSGDVPKEANFQAAAVACSLTEQEFLGAVEIAEHLASQLGPLEGSAEMPNAMEIVYQEALALGRQGAMDQLFGAMDRAAALYLKSITLLSFLLVEASSLELNPSFSLSISDRERLHQYIDRLTTHRHQSIMHNTPPSQHEGPQSV